MEFYSKVTNPVGAGVDFITMPLNGKDSASIAEWGARLGAISSIALVSIGASLAQFPAFAATAISVIPAGIVLGILFFAIWAMAYELRNRQSLSDLENKLDAANKKHDNQMLEQVQITEENIKLHTSNQKNLNDVLLSIQESIRTIRKETQDTPKPSQNPQLEKQLIQLANQASKLKELRQTVNDENSIDKIDDQLEDIRLQRLEIRKQLKTRQ